MFDLARSDKLCLLRSPSVALRRDQAALGIFPTPARPPEAILRLRLWLVMGIFLSTHASFQSRTTRSESQALLGCGLFRTLAQRRRSGPSTFPGRGCLTMSSTTATH